MALSKEQFDVLSSLAEKDGSGLSVCRQRTGISPGSFCRTVAELTEAGYIADGTVTPAGVSALEPYRAKRAVFLAAGFGNRMVPVTLHTPKPLVRVNGKRMIDTLIDACLLAGITEIYVVRGYLADRFDELLSAYPMIRFIDNPDYNDANNIGSALLARHLFENAYIFESDLVLYNPSVITKYHYGSDVLGIWKHESDDWCLDVDENGTVTDEHVGGHDTYQMVGIYYFNQSDGCRLSRHIKEAYDAPGGKERYWETVVNVVYRGQYAVTVRPISEKDVIEIDTLQELAAVDPSYGA